MCVLNKNGETCESRRDVDRTSQRVAKGDKVNYMFFMGRVPKDNLLTAFKVHIFFDDQDLHLTSLSVPDDKGPYRRETDRSDDRTRGIRAAS